MAPQVNPKEWNTGSATMNLSKGVKSASAPANPNCDLESSRY
jgi:hypothetical protein